MSSSAVPWRVLIASASLLVLCSCAGTARRSGGPSATRFPVITDPRAEITAARGALANDPNDVDAWFRLALAWQADSASAGHADSAAAAFESLLDVDPNNVEAVVHYGLALEDLRRFDEARLEYEKATELAPDDPLPFINLGSLLYFHSRETYAAKEALMRALEIDPKNADAHFNLGVLFADANMFGEAKVEWERVLELAPDGPARALAQENLERIRPLVEADRTGE